MTIADDLEAARRECERTYRPRQPQTRISAVVDYVCHSPEYLAARKVYQALAVKCGLLRANQRD
jgi:hypothetical protein